MCGIVGYFMGGDNYISDPAALAAGVRALDHRGPDQNGIWENGRTGLGSARLAVQDLSDKGRQPMATSDDRYRIVYNGEIYNFLEIADDFKNRGRDLYSTTDTEVLLRLFSQDGLDCLDRLKGMFAFSVYDAGRDELTLVRDRFGVKPLYVFDSPMGYFFASEIKALIPFVEKYDLPWELNTEALYEYFLFRHVTGARTLIKNVSKICPGDWMVIGRDGTAKSGKYYDMNAHYDARAEAEKSDPVEAIERLHENLKESVRYRLISDADLGIALSGGVDSSLITALACQHSGKSIKTYSITLPGYEDESAQQNFVAGKFGTDHCDIPLDVETFPKYYLQSVWANDEPLFDPQSIPLYLLAAEASKSVKVLLGGEGADEVFAGYEYPKHLCYYKKGRKLNPLIHRYARVADIKGITENIPPNLQYRESILNDCAMVGVDQHINYMMHTFLQPINNRADKMYMANGIEFREPYLDHDLVEASLNLPERLKVDGSMTKVVLKKISEKYYPKSHIYRPKTGFPLPINDWLKSKKYFGGYVDILQEKRTLDREHINKGGLSNLINRFYGENDKFEYSMGGRIWILLNIEMFIRMFIEDKKLLVN